MPPKKVAPPPASKKADQKKKEKIVEDKTFGLKNKKGAKQQKFIKQVANRVQTGQGGKQAVAKDQDKKVKKEDKLKELEELNSLFKPVVAAQKVSKGADPKSVVCAFYKQGQCKKGDRCKFSHDLSLERKSEKRSVYVDIRDEETEKESVNKWDEQKLEEASLKYGADDKRKPKTSIICKHFLDALEKEKYGWFWNCPNGENCIYRHALPPGFVLKKDVKKEEKEEEISLEDLIERERAVLGANVNKLTLEAFIQWKKKKREEKKEKALTALEKRKADFNAGKTFGISGREIFEFHPDLVSADDDEAAETQYERETDDSTNSDSSEVDMSLFVEREVDSVGITVSSGNQRAGPPCTLSSSDLENGKFAEACGGLGTSRYIQRKSATNAQIDGVPVDENLFMEEDFDGLEEELEELDVED